VKCPGLLQSIFLSPSETEVPQQFEKTGDLFPLIVVFGEDVQRKGNFHKVLKVHMTSSSVWSISATISGGKGDRRRPTTIFYKRTKTKEPPVTYQRFFVNKLNKDSYRRHWLKKKKKLLAVRFFIPF